MALFGRSSGSRRDRTPDERAAARAERERRRVGADGGETQADPGDPPDPPPAPQHSHPPEPPPPEPTVAPQPTVAPAEAPRQPEPIQIDPGGGAEPIVEAGGAAPGAAGERRERTLLHPRRGGRGGPPPRRRRTASRTETEGRRHSRLGRFFAVIALLLIAAVIFFWVEIFQPFHGAGHGRVEVVIPKGDSTHAIGDLLASRGVVSSGFFFYLRAKVSGKGSDIRPGRYVLEQDMSYGAALDALNKGPYVVPVVNVTIPEGSTRHGIAQLARADGLSGSYLAASARSASLDPRSYGAPRGAGLEGFLFPDTFQLKAGTPARELVDLQLRDFKRRFAHVNLAAARRAHLSAYDVVIVASMIEKEARLDRERALISAVIYNRLRTHTPLGIDATLLYGLFGDFTHPLTNADLQSRTPYNTRLRQGLPPTPIANPGLKSLQAAAHPAHVPYLFYVVIPGPCGQHVFTTSYQQFRVAARRYQSAKAANGGRSPQHC